MALLLSSCSVDQPSQAQDELWHAVDEQAVAYRDLGEAEMTAVSVTPKESVTSAAIIKAQQNIARSHPQRHQHDVKILEENLRNSHARLAAKRADVCPKLLQKGVDSAVITRANDIMIEDHCDYFIYPERGQQIMVTSSTDQIESMLIVPELYCFDNGAYLVTSSQKHIIRLAYDGIMHKPPAFEYNMTVSINDHSRSLHS